MFGCRRRVASSWVVRCSSSDRCRVGSDVPGRSPNGFRSRPFQGRDGCHEVPSAHRYQHRLSGYGQGPHAALLHAQRLLRLPAGGQRAAGVHPPADQGSRPHADPRSAGRRDADRGRRPGPQARWACRRIRPSRSCPSAASWRIACSASWSSSGGCPSWASAWACRN